MREQHLGRNQKKKRSLINIITITNLCSRLMWTSSSSEKTFREDFCGTFKLSCEWVKLNPHFESYGVDLDPEPIAYGKENYLPELLKDQQDRIKITEGNVLDAGLPRTDIIAACNFSYFIFKERETLKKYFANNLKALNDDGIFILDICVEIRN